MKRRLSASNQDAARTVALNPSLSPLTLHEAARAGTAPGGSTHSWVRPLLNTLPCGTADAEGLVLSTTQTWPPSHPRWGAGMAALRIFDLPGGAPVLQGDR